LEYLFLEIGPYFVVYVYADFSQPYTSKTLTGKECLRFAEGEARKKIKMRALWIEKFMERAEACVLVYLRFAFLFPLFVSLDTNLIHSICKR